VPTDRGYRFYIDAVMDVPPFSAEQVRQLAGQIHSAEVDAEELLERAGALLSDLSHQAAFSVARTLKQSTMRQIELVPLGTRRILCVMIGNEEIVASHVVETAEPLTREEAAALVRFLNTELAGLPFAELLGSLERRMLAERDSLYYLVKRSLDILQHALSTEPGERFSLQGASYIVAQPEFHRDPLKASVLLRGLDADGLLLERIRQDAADARTKILVGHEVQVPGLEDCSLVIAPIVFRHEAAGAIGVLGPRRMEYPRMLQLVEAMGRSVSDVLRRWDQP
jgi:heat-inducible transcriptional repressor